MRMAPAVLCKDEGQGRAIQLLPQRRLHRTARVQLESKRIVVRRRCSEPPCSSLARWGGAVESLQHPLSVYDDPLRAADPTALAAGMGPHQSHRRLCLVGRHDAGSRRVYAASITRSVTFDGATVYLCPNNAQAPSWASMSVRHG
jgi:hypothetical protein